MPFPTIRMEDPVEDPCEHVFPYDTADGLTEIRPCTYCGAAWADRNRGFNGCSIWSFPRGMWSS
jgi:hypothetical protein